MISEFYINRKHNLILETSVNVIIIISEICTGATVIGLVAFQIREGKKLD